MVVLLLGLAACVIGVGVFLRWRTYVLDMADDAHVSDHWLRARIRERRED